MRAYELSPPVESAQPDQAASMSGEQYPGCHPAWEAKQTHKSVWVDYPGSDELANWESCDDNTARRFSISTLLARRLAHPNRHVGHGRARLDRKSVV